jgi:hypothetical protein
MIIHHLMTSTTADLSPPIDIQALDVRRGGRVVLRGVDLQVAGGRVTGLLGPSGSGKTGSFKRQPRRRVLDIGGGMSIAATLATSRRILLQLRRDHRTMALVLVLPPLLLALFKYVFDDQPQTFQRIAPALVGLFPFTVVFLVTSIAMLRERTGGTLERLMSLPLAKLRNSRCELQRRRRSRYRRHGGSNPPVSGVGGRNPETPNALTTPDWKNIRKKSRGGRQDGTDRREHRN